MTDHKEAQSRVTLLVGLTRLDWIGDYAEYMTKSGAEITNKEGS